MRSSSSVLSLAIPVGLAGAVVLASACGVSTAEVGPGTGPSAEGGTTPVDPGVSGVIPCDVDKVLATSCRSCHDTSPKFGSLMPLVTLADLRAPAISDSSRKVYQLVAERIADDARPMPQPPNARLSAADRDTLTKWAAAGAPAVGPTDCAVVPPPVNPMTTCKPDLPIGPASDWEMPTDSGDEYVCYGVELSRPTPTHVVGFSPRIDNTKIVHHVVLFEADSAVSPTPTKCSSGGSLQWRMVTGWAPGGKGFELPPEAGFPLKTTGTTHYVVQMHYSNPQALAGQKDHSGFDLCTSAPRQYEADVLAFGTQTIKIPAGAAYERTSSITVPQQLAGIHLIAAMPHMHKLGTEMSTELLAGGPAGASTDLGTVKSWDFNTQAWLEIKGVGGAVTKANDVIRTRCAWMNSTGAEVSFGEKTADEMCYSFTAYYPRITSTIWSWAAPALTSTCQ
jgi:cytochrome c551/c552